VAGTQLDILDLLGGVDAADDLPRLVAGRIFAGHRRRWALLQHQRGSLAHDGLVTSLGGPFGGAGRDDDLWLSWATRRSGVDVDWTRAGGGGHEHLPWPTVVGAALDGLTAEDAASLDAAEARLRAARLAAEVKFARLALHDDDGNPILWVAPWDTADGLKAGTSAPGARCWLCGDIEPNEHMLALNHGLATHYPESIEWTTCAAQDRAEIRAGRELGGDQ
jgi:hypothetical protein